MASLYLHVPFCRRKCPYCDFYSVEESRDALDVYPALLQRHLLLTAAAEPHWGPFASVFFGGGTPSLLPPAGVGRVLESADDHFGIVSDAEITLEANPGTVTAATLAGYRAAGINRLSFGIQSLHPGHLQLLGRIHSPQEARQAVALARRAGFDNISCDLMFALTDQTPDTLAAEIEEFIALEPDHLSCYGLSVEEGTPFAHRHRAGSLSLPDEESYAQQFLLLHELLTAAGFGHYEIANYARPGRECRHNLGYWRRGSYLGIGAGAHSFSSRSWGRRLAVPADLTRYADALQRGDDPAASLESFDRSGAMAETVYLGLRTREGISAEAFHRRFCCELPQAFPEAVARAGARLTLQGDRWGFDLTGWLLYDHLIAPFL